MHDPQTLAWEIKYPWWKHRPWPKKHRHSEDRKWQFKRMQREIPEREIRRYDSFWEEGYRHTFISIWHVDPEKGGSDDSCGWSYPTLTKQQKNKLRNASWDEGSNPHFLRCAGKHWDGTIAEVECLRRGLVLQVCRVLKIKMTFAEASRYAAEATHIRCVSKAGEMFCFLPGYHTNRVEVTEEDRREHFYGILCGVARGLLGHKRPWYRHPKYHFWHFRFQVHPWQTLRRWLLTRCCKCGKRFAWGESPVTSQWDAPRPKFLRGEKHLYHGNCSDMEKRPQQANN